jgi:16S rRNA G966 N2-methylase RsmD
MNTDIINKIFPVNKNSINLKYDDEGLWSITLPDEADLISKMILNDIKDINGSVIFDGMSGLGGNLISFSKYFKKVIGFEINKNRYNLLKNNLNIFNINNALIRNESCISYLNEYCDAYFFDPPWGGPNYKNTKLIKITIDNLSLYDIVKKIKQNNKYIYLKLPVNYDLNEFIEFNYKILPIKNYLIIAIY